MIPLHFEPKIHSFSQVSSTNEILRDLALKGASEGTVVVSRSQSHGRGRLGREWRSPLGGLYVSVLLYPLTPQRITDLPFLVAVAVVQSLEQILPKACTTSLKWPNDILVDRKKMGGILAEAFGEDQFYGGIVGLGINVNTTLKDLEDFQERPFQATSVAALIQGQETDLDSLLQIFLAKLFNLYRLYQEKGFAPIRALWERNCAMVGKEIEIRDVEPKGETLKGKFWGISERGGLLLDLGSSEKREILSGDLTCCWF